MEGNWKVENLKGNAKQSGLKSVQYGRVDFRALELKLVPTPTKPAIRELLMFLQLGALWLWDHAADSQLNKMVPEPKKKKATAIPSARQGAEDVIFKNHTLYRFSPSVLTHPRVATAAR